MRSVADDSIRTGANFVVGANRPDYHVRNACYPRDIKPDVIADIAMAQAGHGCTRCDSSLQADRAIEVGHVFKLGTFYSESLEATYLDSDGAQKPIIMGCYGIGVGRLLAAAIEQNNDEKGIVFPASIAPFQVYLAALNVDDPEVSQAAGDLYAQLVEAGLETLYDDRVESAGVKFNDADLLGLPVRVVVGPRGLREGAAEVRRRDEPEGRAVELAQRGGGRAGRCCRRLRGRVRHQTAPLMVSPVEPFERGSRRMAGYVLHGRTIPAQESIPCTTLDCGYPPQSTGRSW